jgi:hypothetical protein
MDQEIHLESPTIHVPCHVHEPGLGSRAIHAAHNVKNPNAQVSSPCDAEAIMPSRVPRRVSGLGSLL